MKAKVKINTNQLNRSLAEVQKRVARVGTDVIEDVAEMAAAFAQSEYSNAQYDGENDIVVHPPEKSGARTVEFIIEGSAFPFIEYGSGTRAGNGYSTTKKYWFFSSGGRRVQLKAGGARAHYYRTTEKKPRLGYMDEGVWTKLKVTSKNQSRVDIKKMTYTDIYGDVFKLKAKLTRVKVPPYPVEKSNSYITKGNPPADVLPRMKKLIESTMLAKFEAKFKK